MSKNGVLITVEKTAEGLGGSTQAKRLVENLHGQGIPAMYTYQPGDTETGSELRKIIKHATEPLTLATELYLILADRAHHYATKIKPALSAGIVVVCDRWLDSTLVYQGRARGWSLDQLLDLHHTCTDSRLPDLTFVFHGTPHRKLGDDRFERETVEFHEKVMQGFLDLATTSSRYELLPANQSEEELASQVLSVVTQRFPALGIL